MYVFIDNFLSAVACGDSSQTTNTDIKQNNEPASSDVYGDKASLRFDAYEDYLKFVRSADLPDNFVKYETFSQFGEFESLVCAPSYGYDRYNYSIIDKDTGLQLTMYIDHRESITLDSQSQPASKVNENDMRRIPKDGGRVFTQSSVQYKYVNGSLNSINWISDGILYTIHGDLYKCKLDSSSALSKLLKLDTAAEAVASVKMPSEAIK